MEQQIVDIEIMLSGRLNYAFINRKLLAFFTLNYGIHGNQTILAY